MLAFYNTATTKPQILAQLEAHARADDFIHGVYWKNGKGCAVGCTLHGSDHAEYETRFGIPQMLARFGDYLFERLPDAIAKEWPLRFMRAVKPNSDLSCVGWKFLHWLLTDTAVTPGIDHELTTDAIEKCVNVIVPLTEGKPLDKHASKIAVSEARQAAKIAGAAANADLHRLLHTEASRDELPQRLEKTSLLMNAQNAALMAAGAAIGDENNKDFLCVYTVRFIKERDQVAVYVKLADRLIGLIEKAPLGGRLKQKSERRISLAHVQSLRKPRFAKPNQGLGCGPQAIARHNTGDR